MFSKSILHSGGESSCLASLTALPRKTRQNTPCRACGVVRVSPSTLRTASPLWGRSRAHSRLRLRFAGVDGGIGVDGVVGVDAVGACACALRRSRARSRLYFFPPLARGINRHVNLGVGESLFL